jgi:S-disulfanyl-L-cysteine oxidoreductase SoxD
MKLRLGIFAIVASAAMAASYATATLRAQAEGASVKSTWDGVYTAEQADKGSEVYTEKCQSCHGAEAGGADAPALAGAEFAGNWDTMTAAQLFDRIRQTMPQDDPGSMSREETTNLVAYVFSKNAFPVGTALPVEGDALAQIKFLANKP